MSAVPTYPPQYPAQPPLAHHDDDTKAPYDDLIDQYAAPYGTQTHRTYAVDPTSLNLANSRHGRAPSYPLPKQSYSSETTKDIKSLEDHEPDPPDWGYPPTAAQEDAKEEKSWTRWIPDSWACRLYLLTVLVETAIDLAIEGDIFLRFHESKSSDSEDMATRRMPVYLAIFALAHVFQFVMALDAVWARNVLQFISLAIFNALFLLYAIIQITEINAVALQSAEGITDIPVHTLAIIIPIVISVAEIAYIALGWKIYTEFGWKVYKFLGADRRIKTMFAYHQIFLCLVKFDLFFWVGFSVQFIWLVLNKDNAEYYLTCAALPLSLVVLVEGHLAARHESKWMMLSFMTGCAGAMVYFVYKLVKVLRFHNQETFSKVWQTLSTFSVIAIILLIITSVFAVLVMNNFGRGLKEQIAKNKGKQGLSRGKSQYVHRGPMSTHPNRMSID
ncbi:hypothetical protein GY45DRAFT_1239290 [Cubamyces sp. BRFM 1775]|nr:hypothetical protein GY45DRAFT_1239290 [Cubamyces sp. BRFM 1775]